MKAKAKPTPKPGKPPAPLPPGMETLLCRAQVAEALGVTTRTLDAMVSAGEYPRPDTHIGVLPRWRVVSHNTWIESSCKKKGA